MGSKLEDRKLWYSRISRRDLFKLATLIAVLPRAARSAAIQSINSSVQSGQDAVDYLPVSLEQVPIPKKVEFIVHHKEKAPVTLRGLYWYKADAIEQGKKCPAIVEFNPYRCTDGTLYPDSKMYPWFAYNEYLCFRVDLQGSGNSEGIITDEYTEEELSYCVQIIDQIVKLPLLPAKTTYVNPDLYLPVVKTVREATTIRTAELVTIEGRKGVRVKKAIDSGAAVYGGILDQLLVDQKAYETYQIFEGDPLSMTGSVRFESILERGDWKARSVTETRLWSEKTPSGQVAFRYEASTQAFVKDEPFEERRVSGDIPRNWV